MSVLTSQSYNNHQDIETNPIPGNYTVHNLYTTSYVAVVINILNQVGMAPLEQTMKDEAALMDVTDNIQKCLTALQTFYQKIENEATSGGSWIQYHHHSNDFIGPNAYDGLSKDFYYQTLNHSTANNSQSSPDNNDPNTSYYGSEQVGSDYKTAMEGYVNNLKELFQCGTITGDDAIPASQLQSFTVQRVDPKTGKYVTIRVDMTSTYNDLETNAFAPFVKQGVTPFVDPTKYGSTSSSLIMQYVFDKARVAADTLSPGALFNIAIPDPEHPNDPTKWLIQNATKIIDFDPTDGSGDGILKTMFTLLNDLNTTVLVSRSTYDFDSFNNETSANILGQIFDSGGPDYYEGQYDNKHNTGAFLQHYGKMGNDQSVQNQHLGLYGTFSYLAFNYYWSKNPSASISGGQLEYPVDYQNPQYKDPAYEGNGFWSPDGCWGYAPGWNSAPYSGDSGHYGDLRGHPTSDELSSDVSDVQSSTSLLSSANNEASTAMQEFTSESSQFQNIGQNVIKGNSDNLKLDVQNYLG